MQYEMGFTTPPGLNVFETHFFIRREIATQMKQRLAEEGLSFSDIKSIKTGAVNLASEFSGQNLAQLDEVVVDIYPTLDPANRYEAAYSFQIPINAINNLQLAGSLSDLSEVLVEEFFNLELGLRFRNTTQQEFNLRLFIEFNVFIKDE